MKRRTRFRPDLDDSVLESRSLMDGSQVGSPPTALMVGGYAVSPVPSASFSSSLGTLAGLLGTGGAGSSTGMGIATAFYITGFGLSSMTVGNGTGIPGPSAGGLASSGVTPGVNTTVGSGANEPGPATGVARSRFGQSTSLVSGIDFLYIGKTFGSSSVRPAPKAPATPADTPETKEPVAPRRPTVPAAPGQGRPTTNGRRGASPLDSSPDFHESGSLH
jgi:hypothetical protein